MKQIIALGLILISQFALSQEHFVRLDGGTWAQCDGTVNRAYDDSITDRQCAVKHIFELLDPQYQEVRISGGDIITVLNQANGDAAEYIMGSHAEYSSGRCSASWAYDCYLPSIPSGTAEQPTIIRGHTAGQSCDVKPILAGINRAAALFTINSAEHVELSCLRLTDKSSCVGASGFPDASLKCNRASPYNKPFADIGLSMKDSGYIHLSDLDIEGLATGVKAGRLGDVTLERVNLFANYSAGWNGDIDNHSAEPPEHSNNTGTIHFKDSSITFNGCGLIYNPGQPDHRTPHGCANQSIGGYGDGLGTGETGGDWIFENVKVMHNNSDGIDLLYHSLGGKITVTNSRFEGNGSNQLKVAGESEIMNNLIFGNCAWNSRQAAALGGNGEICRASGNALSLSYTHADTKVSVINNTVVSEGDCMIVSGNRTNVDAATQTLNVVNNIFYALNDNHGNMSPEEGDEENSCMYYTDEPFPVRQIHNNIIHKAKGFGSPCTNFQDNIPAGANAGVCTTTVGPYYDNDDRTVSSNPHFTALNIGIQYSAYDVATLDQEANVLAPDNALSPAVNAGYAGVVQGVAVPQTDYYGRPRNGLTDIGAVEFYPSASASPLPPVILSVDVQLQAQSTAQP